MYVCICLGTHAQLHSRWISLNISPPPLPLSTPNETSVDLSWPFSRPGCCERTRGFLTFVFSSQQTLSLSPPASRKCPVPPVPTGAPEAPGTTTKWTTESPQGQFVDRGNNCSYKYSYNRNPTATTKYNKNAAAKKKREREKWTES